MTKYIRFKAAIKNLIKRRILAKIKLKNMEIRIGKFKNKLVLVEFMRYITWDI